MRAPTPSASPMLRTMTFLIEALYCTQLNHEMSQIMGKFTGAPATATFPGLIGPKTRLPISDSASVRANPLSTRSKTCRWSDASCDNRASSNQLFSSALSLTRFAAVSSAPSTRAANRSNRRGT